MFENWRKKLEYKLKKADAEGEIEGLYALIAQVELGLVMLNLLGVKDPDMLWVWLSGYNFPEYKSYSPEQRRALANARLYLSFGRYAWRDYLHQYIDISPKWRLFNVVEGEFSYSDEMTRVTNREDEYLAALQKLPEFQKNSRIIPETKLPVHFIHNGSGIEISLNLDEGLVACAKEQDGNIPRLPDSPILVREELRIPFSALQSFALELNQRFGLEPEESQNAKKVEARAVSSTPHKPEYARDWVKAIRETVQYKSAIRGQDGQYIFGNTNEGDLVISDVTHVAGMVGAGKSTLAELIAMFGVEKGNFRTTLIVGDAQTSLDLADKINQVLGASADKPIAVPLIGKTTRGIHYQKLRRSTSLYGAHWGETWLNPTCLLQGLIPLESIEEPLPQGSEPCERLEQKRKETNVANTNCECPFFPICPSRILDRQIPEARIWVTTPQAMMQSRLPIQIDQRRFRFAELIYFYSDLVIFDEIDADQQVVDDIFAPERHLIQDRSGDLGEADRYSSGWFGLSPKNQTFVRRRRALTNAGIAADHLSNLLENGKFKFLKDWTDNLGYFSPSILFRSIADEIGKITDPLQTSPGSAVSTLRNGPIMEELSKFQDLDKVFLPRGETPGMQMLIDILRNAFLGSYEMDGPQRDAQAWISSSINSFNPSAQAANILGAKLSQLGLKLEFSVVLSALEYYLYELSHGHQDADEDDETNPPSFQHSNNIPSEFLNVIPTSPLGSASGFRYTNDDAKHKGAAPGRKSRHLLYFRFSGLGRSLLLNFSHLFTDSGYPGPNVLCMSGTSWMEDSDEHHFAIEPSGILEAPESSQTAIRESQFMFSPQRDISTSNVIRISGSGNLEAELIKLSIALARSPQVDQSLLSLVMNRLGVLGKQNLKWRDRQRILILVNSYKQAKLVAQTIRDQIYLEKPDWEIYFLERASNAIPGDIEDQWSSPNNGTKSLQRPDLVNFGKMTSAPTILVAPLLSVGRRHNILNQDNSAAFGAVFFATRPMKTPDDLSKWVSWVNHQTIRMMQDTTGKAWKGADTPRDRLSRIRKVMNYWWSRIGSYQGVSSINDKILRRSLAASMAAIIVQATGRLLRNGVPFLAYFIDAAWAPQSANQLPDNAKTSMLVEMLDIVNEYSRTSIGNILFGPLNEALQKIEGVVREQPGSKRGAASSPAGEQKDSEDAFYGEEEAGF